MEHKLPQPVRLSIGPCPLTFALVVWICIFMQLTDAIPRKKKKALILRAVLLFAGDPNRDPLVISPGKSPELFYSREIDPRKQVFPF